jgi:hypothetical protein
MKLKQKQNTSGRSHMEFRINDLKSKLTIMKGQIDIETEKYKQLSRSNQN